MAGPIENLSQGAITQGTTKDLTKIAILYVVVAVGVGIPAAYFMRWDWLNPAFQEQSGVYPNYLWKFVTGVGWTMGLLFGSCILGFLLAIPIGLVQVTGPRWLAAIARGFCTVIRGTPLLIQLWLMYYGLGSLFPGIPGIRDSVIWPLLREAWPYALLAFTLSFAGYEGEIMRGAFAGVPKGELEAAKAFGMPYRTVLRRIWLPRAIHQALPTLSGEVVLQLKSTPLAATVTIFDVFGVGTKVRQDLLIIYEPLLFIAFVYMTLTVLVVLVFRWLESLVPSKRA